jgi:hypothetical protein
MASRQRGNRRIKNRFVADSEDDEDGDDVGIRLKSAQQQGKQPAVPPRPVRKLSFGDDVDEAVVVKKTKKKPKARGISAQTFEPSGADRASSSYSAQELAQLKLSTPQMPDTFAAGDRAAINDTEGASCCSSSAL